MYSYILSFRKIKIHDVKKTENFETPSRTTGYRQASSYLIVKSSRIGSYARSERFNFRYTVRFVLKSPFHVPTLPFSQVQFLARKSYRSHLEICVWTSNFSWNDGTTPWFIRNTSLRPWSLPNMILRRKFRQMISESKKSDEKFMKWFLKPVRGNLKARSNFVVLDRGGSSGYWIY